jgi:hypothetical protein
MFYEKQGMGKESVLEIWNEIAATLKLPPDKLRPTDRFGSDIGMPLITSEDLDTLFELGDARARALGTVVDFAAVKTVDDYVRALARKKMENSAPTTS